MMYIGRSVLHVVLPALLMLSQVPFGHAGLTILSHDVVSNTTTRRSTFSITFDRPPDFYSTSLEGYPRQGFQYFYDSEPGGFEFSGDDVRVIRGVEIRFDDTIPIRESLNPSGEAFPNAEGWGPSRGDVPFELDDETIHFSVPWTMLGEVDGKFSYILFALESGELTDEHHYSRNGVVIPLPGALRALTWLAVVAAPASLMTAAGRRAAWSAIAYAWGARRGNRASATRSRSMLRYAR